MFKFSVHPDMNSKIDNNSNIGFTLNNEKCGTTSVNAKVVHDYKRKNGMDLIADSYRDCEEDEEYLVNFANTSHNPTYDDDETLTTSFQNSFEPNANRNFSEEHTTQSRLNINF